MFRFHNKKPHVNLRKKVSQVRRRGKETSLRKMCQLAPLGKMVSKSSSIVDNFVSKFRVTAARILSYCYMCLN